MKKLIVVLILLATLMSASMPVLADETMKSLYTDEEIASQLRKSDDDIVITLYYGAFMWGFSERMKVEDMPEKELNRYMLISPEGQKKFYMHYEGQLARTKPTKPDWSEFYKYATFPNLVFDAEVEVYDAYCLMNLDDFGGMFIYYKTSHGDYALYKHSEEDEEMYLLPLEELYGLADAFREEMRAHNGTMGAGELNVEELYDLAPYKFKGKTQLEDQGVQWGLYAAIVAVVVVGIGTMCLIVHKKKK